MEAVSERVVTLMTLSLETVIEVTRNDGAVLRIAESGPEIPPANNAAIAGRRLGTAKRRNGRLGGN
jgi:hypothetical protein